MNKNIKKYIDFINEDLSKSYLDGSSEDGFSLSEVRSLEVGNDITFYFNNLLLDGKIIDKEVIGDNTIFTIQTEDGQLKKSYKQLKVYKIY